MFGFFTRTPVTTAPAEAAPLVTYSDPTSWMTDEERAYHTHGGVTR